MKGADDIAGLVEQVLGQQRHRWALGDRVTVEQLVNDYPALANDEQGLVDLVYSEFWLCGQAGQRPDPQEYLRRFPQIRDLLVKQFEVHHVLEGDAADKQAPSPGGAAPTTVSARDTDPPAPGHPPVAAAVLLPEAVISGGGTRYEVLGELGSGGMGIVYRARDNRLQREVALKVMRPEIAADESAKARFLREARAAAAVEHDHLITVFEVGETAEGLLYIAMPLLRGETLEQRLQREPRLPVAEVLRIGSEVAAGLAAAHACGLIHRDIKPSNLWLERRPETDAAAAGGRVKILDFGLTRPLEGSDLSLSGSVMGTPAYMAPEQARGAAVDARADLFSLGCVLYRLTTGEPPFTGKTKWAVLRAVEEHHPPSPRSLRPEIPDALNQLILGLLTKGPAARPSSAVEVEHTLRALPGQPASDSTIMAKKPPAAVSAASTVSYLPFNVGRKSSKWFWLGAGAAVLLIAVLSVYLFRAPEQEVRVVRTRRPGPLQQPALAPLKGSVDVVVARGPQGNRRYLHLKDPEALPLQPGSDHLRIEAHLNRPGYLYLVWVDTEGKASLIYPRDKKRRQSPDNEEPVQDLFLPSALAASPVGGGPAGTETLLLLAREEPLPRDVDIGSLFADLRPQASRYPREAAWFENGKLVRNEMDRGPINFADRGRPLDDEHLQIPIDEPVLQVQALLQTRLRALFPYSRAVCFTNAGDR
jgi:serine/threonine protein kinase